MNQMDQLSSDINWDSLIILAAYGVLILMYLIVLKLLMRCLEQMFNKAPQAQNTVVDMDIRLEAANKHADDKNFMFDPYGVAVVIVKVFFSIAAIVAAYTIVMIKLNVLIATSGAVFIGVAVWRLNEWRKRGGAHKLEEYDEAFARMGGYNIGTLIFLVIAFILATVGLIVLPA